MEFKLHPAAIASINSKAHVIASKIEKFQPLPSDQREVFPTQRPILSTITDKDIVGDIVGWLADTQKRQFFAFIRVGDSVFGLPEDAYMLIDDLIDEILKANFAQKFLSRDFIHQSILNWIRNTYKPEIVEFFSFLSDFCTASIKKFTFYAPISNFEIEEPFDFGGTKIRSLDNEFFIHLEAMLTSHKQKNPEETTKFISKIRKKMQGYAAIVIEFEAEKGFAFEKGNAIASEAVGLLRFLSPSSERSFLLCPVELMGYQPIPEFHFMLLGEDKSFSYTSGVVPKNIGHWQLPKLHLNLIQNNGLPELGHLLSSEKQNDFQKRLKKSIINYTKGTTFSDLGDRLLYTCSSLESLLLKDGSEPIQQNLAERMAFLLSKDANARRTIVKNVKDIYSMRSRYVHHRTLQAEEQTIGMFTYYAFTFLKTALKNIYAFNSTNDFIHAIEQIKFGG